MLHFESVLGCKVSVKVAFIQPIAHQYRNIKVFILLSNLSYIVSAYSTPWDPFAISSTFTSIDD